MKKYRIRKGSPLDKALPFVIILGLIIIAGLGNHYIDGLGV